MALPALTSLDDLVAALTLATVVTIYDDDRDGVPDATALAFNVQRASAQVFSYIMGHYTIGTVPTTDMLLRSCALDYLVAYSFERHPEYVRTFGEAPRAERIKRADATMERIKAGVQRPVETEQVQAAPSKTVGGVILDRGPKMGGEDFP